MRTLAECQYYKLREDNDGFLDLFLKERLPDFFPDVYLDSSFMSKKYQMSIQTTSYGSLKLDQFEEFFEHQKTAFEIAKEFQQAIDQWESERVEND